MMSSDYALRFVDKKCIDSFFETKTFAIVHRPVYSNYFDLERDDESNSLDTVKLKDGESCLLKTSSLNINDLPSHMVGFFVCYRCELKLAAYNKKIYCHLHHTKDACENLRIWKVNWPCVRKCACRNTVKAVNYCLDFECLDISSKGEIGFSVTKKIEKARITDCSISHVLSIESAYRTIHKHLIGYIFYIPLYDYSLYLDELQIIKPKQPISICKAADTGIGFLLRRRCNVPCKHSKCNDTWFTKKYF